MRRPVTSAPQGVAAGRRFHSLVVNRRNYRRRWNCVVLAIVEVVVAVIVVAVPIVVDAVHDNHPLLIDPFPCTQCADPPQRHRRPRPVARIARDVVVAAEMVRRRMVAWLRTDVFMPCRSRLPDMMGRSGMFRRAWLGCRSRDLRSPRLLGRSCSMSTSAVRSPHLLGRSCSMSISAVRSPHLLGGSCRVSATAAGSAFRRRECRCAECRAGDSDECEFHEVVVHSTPLAFCLWFDGEFISPLHQVRSPSRQFLTNKAIEKKR